MEELGTGGAPSWHRRVCETAGSALQRTHFPSSAASNSTIHSEFRKGLAAGINVNTETWGE